MSPDILGSNIRRLRMAKGVSQADLAEAAGLSRPGYRNVEVGAATPRTSTLMRIAEALGVKLEALLGPESDGSELPALAHELLQLHAERFGDGQERT